MKGSVIAATSPDLFVLRELLRRSASNQPQSDPSCEIGLKNNKMSEHFLDGESIKNIPGLLYDRLQTCAKMWTDEARDYILVRTTGTLEEPPWLNCAIFYLPNGTVYLIEDDRLAFEITRRMYAAGVPIVDAESFRSILRTYPPAE